MSRIHDVIGRYDACRALLKHGVEVVAVGDPVGAQLNAVVRRAIYQIGDGGEEVWGDLLRSANALRWRRMMQPQPNAYAAALRDALSAVLREVQLLRGFVGDEALLELIAAAATAVGEAESPVGLELLRSVQEVGVERCVVIANSGSARSGLRSWLEQFGVMVLLPGELHGKAPDIQQSYVVGPPAFFPASLVTAPATEAINFVMPAWFGNRSVPTSRLAELADGGIAVSSRLFLVGDVGDPVADLPLEAVDKDTIYPEPVWERTQEEAQGAEGDEVEAWKVLLGGGRALWLDDGERIRSLDPRQPEGDRISYEAVDDVRPGTYLVLREGATEHRAMYDAALAAVGGRGPSIIGSQTQWKQSLADRLTRVGVQQAVNELRARSVRSATRVSAWTEPTLICPRHRSDFVALLEWLGLPLQPTLANALTLRRALYKASADLRQELEVAVGQADLDALERDGFMHLQLEREGFRGMMVAKVLARAPFTVIRPRAQTRMLFFDGGGKWLE